MTSSDARAIAFGLTFDCTDAPAQARFWALALGYVESPPPEGWETWEQWFVDHEVPVDEWGDGAAICDPSGVQPAISFLRVPEPKRAKNRLHLDVKVSGGRHVDPDERAQRIDAKVDELVTAGAAVHGSHRINEHLDHVVMLDPEGNEFCVV